MEYQANYLQKLTLLAQEHKIEEEYKWLINRMKDAANTGRFGVIIKRTDISYNCLVWLKTIGYCIYGLEENTDNGTIKVPLITNEALSTNAFPRILISWRKENIQEIG